MPVLVHLSVLEIFGDNSAQLWGVLCMSKRLQRVLSLGLTYCSSPSSGIFLPILRGSHRMHPDLPYLFTLNDPDITQFDVDPLTGIERQPVTVDIM